MTMPEVYVADPWMTPVLIARGWTLNFEGPADEKTVDGLLRGLGLKK
jgi:hypothetical protein